MIRVTTLHLPPHLEQRLEALAQQLGKSEQLILKEMLEAALPAPAQKYKRLSIGLGRSNFGDLSERVEVVAQLKIILAQS